MIDPVILNDVLDELALLNSRKHLQQQETMTLKQGQVKYAAGKEFPNRFKPGEMQQNIVVTMEDGTEERIYFTSGRTPHATLKKGDTVNILYEQMNGRTIRKLYANDNPSSNSGSNGSSYQPAAPARQQSPAKPKLSTRDKIAMLANAHVVCIQEVESRLQEAGYPDVEFEDIRTIATSIIINLDRSGDDLMELMTYPSGEPVETVEVAYDDDEEHF